MTKSDKKQTYLTRDQRRAIHAYEVVAKVPKAGQRDYKIAVNSLGANILRSGLAGAMATLERLGERGDLVRHHIAKADVPGLSHATKESLPDLVRKLPLDDYIMATREILQVSLWLKRATQALIADDKRPQGNEVANA